MGSNIIYTICPRCGYIGLNEDKCKVCDSTMIHTNIPMYNQIYGFDLDIRFEEMYDNYVKKSTIFDEELFEKSKKINKISKHRLANYGFGRIYVCPKCGKVPRNRHTDRCDYCGYELIATNGCFYDYVSVVRGDGHHMTEAGKSYTNTILKAYCYDNPAWDINIYHQRLDDEERQYQLERRQRMEEQRRREEARRVRCPKCGSISIATTNRGYSLLTGFLGSNKKINVCQSCGYQWSPGKN
ncbi:MAG: hypothetical protein ACI4E3_09185 [Candidatus Fimousia sp.]